MQQEGEYTMIFASFTTLSYKKFYLVKDEYDVKIEMQIA